MIMYTKPQLREFIKRYNDLLYKYESMLTLLRERRSDNYSEIELTSSIERIYERLDFYQQKLDNLESGQK